jgi:2',3'-cyclic-nucleotide 2'-phosphodiesterase (5'-nucleotidase family)
VPDAYVAIGLGARRGGLRTDVAAGALTRGPLYDVFPFDNRVVTLRLTGAQLRQALVVELARGRPGLPGLSGARVEVGCEEERPTLEIAWASGVPIRPTEALVVATTDFFAARASVRSAATPKTEWAFAPLVRDAAATWLTARGGRLGALDLLSPPRWEALDGGACRVAD